MTKQCQALLDELSLLTGAIRECSDKISESIDNIYSSDNTGIERKLDKLTDIIGTFVDIVDRRM